MYMNTNSDMTIYNKYYDKVNKETTWRRTVLSGVFWEGSIGVSLAKKGLNPNDSIIIYVPFHVSTNKKFASPKKFMELSNEEVADWFTIQPGDRIVQGIVEDEITKSTDLDRIHQAYTITNVDCRNFGSLDMRHWEVGAK
jgi:hypothetical protein